MKLTSDNAIKNMRQFVATAIIGTVMAAASVCPAFGAPAPVSNPAGNTADILANVNGTVITKAEFMSALENRFGDDILSEMITEILIDQAAKENKISISDGQINDEIAKVKAQFSSEAEFQSALVQYKLTLDSYKEQMRLRLILARLGEPKPATEAELTAYFNENKAKYDQDEEVNVSHILLKTEDEAKAVLAELAKGADFAKLAKEKSEDPGSKDNGGEIGFAAKGQLVKEFEDAAFKLKPGEISGIVKTQYGYHIIKGIEHRMPKSAVYSDVKKQVAEDYAADNTKKPEEIIAQLKSNAKISVASDSYKSFENNPGAK